MLLALAPALAIAGCVAATDDTGSTESAVTVCGQTSVKGIDVYHGDNGGSPIDWSAVKQAGISFAFAKATESTNFTDSMFKTNWAGMKSAGIVRGAYHFFHADVDPVAQANFFLSTVGPLSPGDMLVLDLETTNGQTEAVIEANAATFLGTVKSASGVTPFLYTSPLFLSSFAKLGAYPLWIANYGVSCPDVPAPWTTYTFWQSSSTSSLGPISGAVDLDSFNGTLTQLESLGSGTPPPPDAGSPGSDAGATSDAGTDAADGGASSSSDGGANGTRPGPASRDPGGQQSTGCSLGLPDRGAGAAGVPALLGLVALRRRRRRLR